MLFLVSGSSGSGKSAVGRLLAERVPSLALLDFDDVPRPVDPTPERWAVLLEQLVQRAVELQAEGRDSLLLGWTPLGELLATPSAPSLEGIAACLLDCDEAERRRRLELRRADGWPEPTPAEVREFLQFAAWLRTDYARRDAPIVDTTDLTVERVADRLERWIRAWSGSGSRPSGSWRPRPSAPSDPPSAPSG